ncbi:hypothetical protein NIES4075_33450 [Tolypothrix sp. NIES-4075]|uniref:hypothetical protein n=1 Tax=Tolypothrix sp. NIES-4075 TaxID=2005459 RepID=UPI000B5C4118|nr:hypothetical protein [Tolypothrix sp. NIES-4075]GAX42344.1 hypothetical protein NIES4075_33450 [Tolypothrix sp. NIES-4075]
MKAIETIATVTSDGKITLQLSADIPPGEHQVVVIIDEKLSEKEVIKKKRPPLDFPVHNCGLMPENLSLRREDMYDDWGR